MTDFWSTNLHIPVGHDRAWLYRADYDATIRQHAFGTFEDLLVALSLHPAMRVYLDNWSSVKNKPNENQGRELLELHTVGRGAGYTEAMVKSSAKILSGYTVDWGKTYDGEVRRQPSTPPEPSTCSASATPNAAADGQAVTVAYLKYLAHHPSTASNLCRKLATYFVSDSPSDGLVARLAQVYLDSGTDMKAVLRALAAHPEFLTSQGQKVRTPVADMVATARVLDRRRAGRPGRRRLRLQRQLGQRRTALFSWPRPDGPPVVGRMWSSASRVFASFDMHLNHAGGWWPKGATYRSAAVVAAGGLDPLRRLRRPPQPHLAGQVRRRPAAEGRHHGGHRTREVGGGHRVDDDHQGPQPRQLAVPATGDRPARHPRPHDHLRP